MEKFEDSDDEDGDDDDEFDGKGKVQVYKVHSVRIDVVAAKGLSLTRT